jgi:hypothetical protein
VESTADGLIYDLLHWTGFNTGHNKVLLQGRAQLNIGGEFMDTVADLYVSHLQSDARVVVVENKPDPCSLSDQLAQGIAEVIAIEELHIGTINFFLTVLLAEY